MLKKNVVTEDTKVSPIPEVQPAQNDAAELPEGEVDQPEIDFDIDFEDDLGPSIEEVLQAATQEVITAQKSENDAEETEPSAETAEAGDLGRHW